MVKFYQSWCGHCMRMAADWDKLAKESPSDVFIADVNCGDEIDVSSFQIIDDDALLHV